MQNTKVESLLEKAKEMTKRYEWLQAVDYYKKTSILFSKNNNFFKAGEIHEKIAFCYFRAALQAQQIEQNKFRANKAIKAHEVAINFFKKIRDQNKKARILHNKGWILFLRSWLESDPKKKKKMFNEWWKLETNNLKTYDKVVDLQYVGKIYNDLLELSSYDRFSFGTDYLEVNKMAEEYVNLGEKAIKILSKENNSYELARSYCWTSWYYGIYLLFNLMPNKRDEFGKKSLIYSKKAVNLSQVIGDALLLGWSYSSASLITFAYENDLLSSIEYNDKAVKQGITTKDNLLLAITMFVKANRIFNQSTAIEDPEKQKESLKKVLKYNEKFKKFSDLSNFLFFRFVSRNSITGDLNNLASYETNLEARRIIFEKIIKTAKENLSLVPEGYQNLSWTYISLSEAFFNLSKILSSSNKKHNLLEALIYREKAIGLYERFFPRVYSVRSVLYRKKAQIQIALAKINENRVKKSELLDSAIFSSENSLKLLEKINVDYSQDWIVAVHGHRQYQLGRILHQLYSLTKKETLIIKAIELYDNSIENYKKAKHHSNLAESFWQKAKINDQLNKRVLAAKNYDFASKAYLKASEKMPKLKKFYLNLSVYMQAWAEIENAKYHHLREEYYKARINYEKAAVLHKKLDNWNYLFANYNALAEIENAEELSRMEKPQESIEKFQRAIENFQKTKKYIKTKIGENSNTEEKYFITRILKASEIRNKYCQARILMEEAKLLDRDGKYLDSSVSYVKAAQIISVIAEKIENEAEHKELKYVEILCQAWEKMAIAEERSSSESYLEAAELFEQAKDLCYTKKASLWALGNSNFCRGLAAGLEYKTSLDLADHSRAKGFIKIASTDYLQAGFNNASEYANATLRLFDAYLYINKAESELDQQIRAKQYQMVEKLLQVDIDSFTKAKQPEKAANVKEIIANVREEKELAFSLSQVMKVPTIASSTSSFSAPATTNESSVGLDSFEHANVQANLVAGLVEVKVGESFCYSIEFVNAGREPALLLRVENFVHSDFVVVKKPEIYRIEDTTLIMKGKQIQPLKFVEVKLTLQPSKEGEYQLNPKVHYLDELGQNNSLQLKPLKIKVNQMVLPDRISTGTDELDSLMFGGIPREYAVVLTGSPSDERESIIKNFLEAGIKNDEIVFYISSEANNLKSLENPNFILFFCNPKPKTMVPNQPNIYRLRSKTDLTNLSISLAKAYRKIDQSKNKRICIRTVSDVLVDYGTKATRKWISELITDLGAKGFTLLAVMDPKEHPLDQATTVMNLFDGEINITQSSDPLDCKKSILVKKLRNQDYIKNPICLT
ncbi:MAG: ATPase domain-containing protein [Candidatus Bathyarchaeota archaeon]